MLKIQNKIVNTSSNLETLYEDVRNKGYWDTLLIEENWDQLYDEYLRYEWMYGMICESVELISQTEDKFIYKIIADRNPDLEIYLHITLLNKDKISNKVISLLYSNQNNKITQALIKDLQNTVNKTTLPIIHISFADKEGKMDITNKGGRYVLSIFNALNLCFTNFQARNKGLPDLVFYSVYTIEEKRVNLYQKFFKDIFYFKLKNSFIDKSRKDIIQVFLWKTLS